MPEAPRKSMENRTLRLSTALGDDVLLLRSMTGTEALGRLFSYELDLLSEQHDINLGALIGRPVAIGLATTTGKERYFHGYVSRFTQVSTFGRLAEYRATVVPFLWFLTRRSDCRIFQEMSVPDIIKDVLGQRGLTDIDESGLTGRHDPWEYCVQYRESDFNFISRLMEQEGIYYYFRHEEDKHVLVLCDSPDAHAVSAEHPSLPYRPQAAGTDEPDRVTDWRISSEFLPAAYAHRDFDFENPANELLGVQGETVDGVSPDMEVYDYPGEYVKQADADELARIRLEEIGSGRLVGVGRTDARSLAVGQKFTLQEHPRDDQNVEHLLVSSTFSITSDDFEGGAGAGEEPQYACEFTCIDATRPFRPARTTPKPVVQGCQTAIVTGKSGEEIWTDKHGRVKVQFHWDRAATGDEQSSCWIRVAQMWAGKKWGAMFLPRVGQEVIVEFLEGDPDCPIITGRVYNGTNAPPYELPAEKTKSTIKTLSSKGGGGFNELRFEDKKDSEQVFVHAQKNMDVRVKNDAFESIENDRHLAVTNDQFIKIGNNRHTKIGADDFHTIEKDHHLKITGKQAVEVGDSHSFTVKGDVIEVFKGNHSSEVTSNLYLKAQGIVIEATNGITLKSGSNEVVIDSAGVTVKGSTVVIDSSSVMIASGPGSSGQSGSAGSAVAPTAAEEAEEADSADPGEVEEVKARQLATQSGKYGKQKVTPLKPTEEEKKTLSWIEIELVDEEDAPVAGEPYLVKTPDGRVASGTLSERGLARIEGVEPGECQICFPRLDQEAWERI